MKVDYNTDTQKYCIIELEPDEMSSLAAACGSFAKELLVAQQTTGDEQANINELIGLLLDIEKGYREQGL